MWDKMSSSRKRVDGLMKNGTKVVTRCIKEQSIDIWYWKRYSMSYGFGKRKAPYEFFNNVYGQLQMVTLEVLYCWKLLVFGLLCCDQRHRRTFYWIGNKSIYFLLGLPFLHSYSTDMLYVFSAVLAFWAICI